MSNEKTGGPAYPANMIGCKMSEWESDAIFKYAGPYPGMTLLDHFAGLAMQALIAKLPIELTNTGDDKFRLTAAGAYAYAAAMIAERNRLMNEKP